MLNEDFLFQVVKHPCNQPKRPFETVPSFPLVESQPGLQLSSSVASY